MARIHSGSLTLLTYFAEQNSRPISVTSADYRPGLGPSVDGAWAPFSDVVAGDARCILTLVLSLFAAEVRP